MKWTGLKLRQVATVVNGVADTPKDWHKVKSRLVFEEQYVEGLYRLAESKRIWVIFGFHKRRGWQPRVRPRAAKDESMTGIFASRSVQRPNKIGLTLVELVGIQGNIVTVEGLDAFDGSPVFDIKPYEKDYDLSK